MNNIKKIYQYAGKCDDQQNLKDILEAAILSTPEGLTDNSPNVQMTSSQVNKISAMKSLCLFTNILAVKLATAKIFLLLQNPDAKPRKCVIAFERKKLKRALKINE